MQHRWSSGRIRRCHRRGPCSIHGRCIPFCFSFFLHLSIEMSFSLNYCLSTEYYCFDCTHNAIPPRTKPIPNHVSLAIIFFSTYHSPRTVNKNALEFASGTVRDSSIARSALSLIARRRGRYHASQQGERTRHSRLG